MMKFTLGIAIIAFTTIVGAYKFFDNVELTQIKERGLQETIERKERFKKIKLRSKRITQMAIVRGDDKKNTVERMLGIADKPLEFGFVGQPKIDPSSPALVRHTFKITGHANFMTLLELLQAMRTVPGFAAHNVCYGCTKTNASLNIDEHTVIVEGYLYAYDPSLI